MQQSSRGLSRFINRSAIKLANIDALLGFELVCTPNARGQEQPDSTAPNDQRGHFTFVDLCGAPGGFSEYILFRYAHPVQGKRNKSGGTEGQEQWEKNACCGFGMSLSGTNEDGKGAIWALDHLKQYHLERADAPETKGRAKPKCVYHICKGSDGTGSIYNWDNVLQLQREISMTLAGKEGGAGESGPFAHLVVADGGFDAQRDSENQELMAHRIVVSQTAAALTLLRPSGQFVLKMFGFRDQVTRRMLRYLYDRFDRMAFVKPVLSRPASAERYLVCCGYSGQGSDWNGLAWREHMIAQEMPGEDSLAPEYGQLEHLMSSFDQEMIELNEATCRSIIDYLEKRRKSIEDDVPFAHEKEYIDIKSYEAAWSIA